MLMYTGYVKPFQKPLHNRLEISNETLILFNSYFMIIFSNFVPDVEVRYKMGWYNLAVIFGIVIVNLGIIGVTIGARIFNYIKLVWLKRRQ